MSTNASPTTNSTIIPISDEPFAPRKEFLSTAAGAIHDYSLISLSAANVIKFTRFPPDVLEGLRIELKGENGRGEGIKWERKGEGEEREGEEVEWWLIGKPWKDRRLTSELLLVILFSHLISHSFRFVTFLTPPSYSTSSSDTHVTAVFARPLEPPLVPPARSAFALSFPSEVVLRVVGAPLSETPGILAAIRAGWAKNAKEERRLGGGCFQFKLKTSGWFSSSMTDSERESLSLDLLHSFDRQGLYLITIMRLNGAEVWIFECPAGPTE